jgi:hypothetical protein
VAVFAPVMGNPGSKELLQTRESAGSQHLGPQWVALELFQIGLWDAQISAVLMDMTIVSYPPRGIHLRRRPL